MNVWKTLPKPFFVLAPMDDVTDTVFRRVIADCAAPDLFFTEFTNVDGLMSAGRSRVERKLKLVDQRETPLIAHIWGKRPENFYKAAAELATSGKYAGIDLNMGCPDKTIVKNGCCSALINDRQLAQDIIIATQEGSNGRLPVSVKTRLGFNEVDLTWHEMLLKHDLAALTIHGRTRKQMSLTPADWSLIGEIREIRDRLSAETIIVGNGDVMSRRQGYELATEYGIDGVMIARGVFHDPYVFAEESPWYDLSRRERIDLYKKHVTMFAETWQPGERNIHTLNKFCKIYINGFSGAKELRERLMNAQSSDELLALLDIA